MIKKFILIYAVLFSFLTNCFALFQRNPILLILSILLFAALNIFSGMIVTDSKSLRLRALCHGMTLLISFCVSVVISVLVHFVLLINIKNIGHSTLLLSAVYCYITNYLLFWNGIICVYLTSVQLGIKIRVIGVLCGMIPIAHLIALGVIISKVYSELFVELKKEKVNEQRKNLKICQTKYPLFLVHGVFFRDSKKFNYWGRIPKELQLNGAKCYYGNHQSASSVEESGKEIAERIKEIVNKTGCEKLNIIAHSKGGLDCRYALANCDISQYIASFTTVSTPHCGCLFAEWILKKAPSKIKDKVAFSYNKAAKAMGDKEPDFIAAISDLEFERCKEFNRNTPTPEGIYCQSYGSVMHKAHYGRFPLNLSYNFVKLFDGKNDGLVGVDSFKWGSRFVLFDVPVKRGISHADMIDLNRENIKGFDIREFYVNLVAGLKEQGF